MIANRECDADVPSSISSSSWFLYRSNFDTPESSLSCWLSPLRWAGFLMLFMWMYSSWNFKCHEEKCDERKCLKYWWLKYCKKNPFDIYPMTCSRLECYSSEYIDLKWKKKKTMKNKQRQNRNGCNYQLNFKFWTKIDDNWKEIEVIIHIFTQWFGHIGTVVEKLPLILMKTCSIKQQVESWMCFVCFLTSEFHH